MNKSIILKILSFFFLILMQVTVLDSISLWGYATPLLFIYFILKLPISITSGWVMTLSFLTGLTIDIFSNTPGMNALAALSMGGMRRMWLSISLNKNDEEKITFSPSSYNLGISNFIRYTSGMVFTFCSVLFLVEAFTFINILGTLVKIVSSGILTLILIIAIDSITADRQ